MSADARSSDLSRAEACRRCGQWPRPGAAFCLRCGAALSPDAAERAGDRPSVAFLYGLGLVIAVTAYVAATVGFGPDNVLVNSIDVREIFTYQKEFYRQALADGRLPLWNPRTFSGWPFAANFLTQTFYPPALLCLVLPQHAALVVDLVFHLALAAIGGMMLLRRAFGLPREAAAFGGLVFATCGSLGGQIYAGHIQFYAAAAYMPLVLLCVDRTIAGRCDAARRAGAWPWLGGVLFGLQILTGGIPYVWWSTLFVGLFCLCEIIRRGAGLWRVWAKTAAALGLVTTLGTCVGMVQLAPGYELAALCNRGGGSFEYAMTGSFRPELFMKFIHAGDKPGTQDSIYEAYAYAGIAPLLLGVAGLARVRRERRVVALLAIGVFAGVLMMGSGTPVLPFLWKYVPGFGSFRVPSRALIVVHFAIAVLATIGLAGLIGLVRRWGMRSVAAGAAVAAILAAVQFGDMIHGLRANQNRLTAASDGFLNNPQQRQLLDSLAADQSWHRLWLPAKLWRRNHAFAMNSRSITGYDNMYMERYSRFIHAMTDTEIEPLRVSIISEKTFGNAKTPYPFRILGEKFSGHAQARGVPRPEPRRAWFVTRAVPVADEAAGLKYMRGEQFRPFDEVVFEPAESDRLRVAAAASQPASAGAVSIQVTETVPEHLEIRLGPHPAGYLVLSEIFYPGWEAAMNGAPVEIHRADSILRCVAVPEGGDATITMDFRPATVRVGGWVSSAGTLIAVLGMCIAAIRRPRSATGLPAGALRD